MFGRVNPPGLVYKIDLSKIADRANPLTVEAPIGAEIQEPTVIDWGDGSSETVTTGTFPTHTYETSGVYTVTLRSATGHLPFCYFSKEAASPDTPSGSITFAIVSLDHFAGWLGGQSSKSYGSGVRNTRNLKYCDPRIVGLNRWTTLNSAFMTSGIEQPADSFCFDFVTQIISFQNCFRDCAALNPPPFVFWNEDGTVDSDRFPSLSGYVNCYNGCSEALRAQVPVAYGGTMTVN